MKARRLMVLYRDGAEVAHFRIALGPTPAGAKQLQGDGRTPEGRYILDHKKTDSAFHRAIRISYPNERDIQNAKRLGGSPGGAVMIHGQKNGLGWLAPLTQRFDWPAGCIGLSNADMDRVWSMVPVGTPIEIQP